MAANLLSHIGWLAFTLLIGGLQISASVLFLREQNIGPKLMLGGGIISLLGGIASRIMVLLMTTSGNFKPEFFTAISAVGVLGTLLFFIGLLLLALHRRGLAARITELETILTSQEGRQ